MKVQKIFPDMKLKISMALTTSMAYIRMLRFPVYDASPLLCIHVM